MTWNVQIKDTNRDLLLSIKAETTKEAIEIYRVLKKKYEGQDKIVVLNNGKDE